MPYFDRIKVSVKNKVPICAAPNDASSTTLTGLTGLKHDSSKDSSLLDDSFSTQNAKQKIDNVSDFNESFKFRVVLG